MTQRGVATPGHSVGLGYSVTSLAAAWLLSLFVIVSGSPRSIPWGEVGTLPPPMSTLRPLAPCPCDMTSGNCDTGCCCDQDCHSANSAHRCILGLPGGNPTPKITSFDCSDDSAPHRPPLICVTKNNNPFLGNRFITATPIQTLSRFAELKKSRSQSGDLVELSQKSKVIPGASKWIVQKQYLMSSPVMSGIEENSELFYNLLRLPQPMFGKTCSNRPVRFLKDMQYSCVREMNEKSCVQDETFIALRYFLSGSDTYPECNDTIQMPFLIGNLGSKETVPTNVRVFHQKDIYHRLKFTSNDGQFTANAKKALESWYGNIQAVPEQRSIVTPVMDEKTLLCHNAVVGVSYIFTWKGSNITGINIDLEIGSIPVRTPLQLFSQSTSNKGKSSPNRRVKVHLIQNFNIKFKYNTERVPYPTSTENTTGLFWSNETDPFMEINGTVFNESDSPFHSTNFTDDKFPSGIGNGDLNSTNENDFLRNASDVQNLTTLATSTIASNAAMEDDSTSGSGSQPDGVLNDYSSIPSSGSGQYPIREVDNASLEGNDLTRSENSMGLNHQEIPADKSLLPGSGDFDVNLNLANGRDTGSGVSVTISAKDESPVSEQNGNSRTKRAVDGDITPETYEHIFSGFGAFDEYFPNSPDDDYNNNDQGSGFSTFQKSTVDLDEGHLTTTEFSTNVKISTRAPTQITNSWDVTQTHSQTSRFKTHATSLDAAFAFTKRISVFSSRRPGSSSIISSDETHTTHEMRSTASSSRRVSTTRDTVNYDEASAMTLSLISPRTSAATALNTATRETSNEEIILVTDEINVNRDTTSSIHNDFDEITSSNKVDAIDSIDDSQVARKYTDTPRASRVTRSTTNLKNASTTATSESVLANYSSTVHSTNLTQNYSETTKIVSHVDDEEPTTTEYPQFETTEVFPEEIINASQTTTPIDVITGDGDQDKIMDTSYELTASGHRGYIFGAPLIAANFGVPEVDYGTNDTRDVFSNTSEADGGLLVWNPSLAATGDTLGFDEDPWDCDMADTVPVTYGQSVSSGCLMKLADEQLMDCASLREAALYRLRQLLPSSHIAALGHTADGGHQQDQDDYYVPVIGVDLLLESSSEPVGAGPEDADSVEGGGACVVPVGVHYEILTMCAVNRGQHCVVYAVGGVSMQLQHERISLTPSPYPGHGNVVPPIWLGSSASFQEVPELPQTARFWLKQGDPHCVGDVCWRNILRPWTMSPSLTFHPIVSQEKSRESHQLAEESWFAALHYDYMEGLYVDTATLLVLTLLVGLLTATQALGLG